MNLLTQIVAQAESALNAHPVLLAYGPMGLMLGWFMLRGEVFLKAVRDLGPKIERTNHNINGLRMGILLSTLAKESTPEHVRNACNEELSRARVSTPPVETYQKEGS